MSERLGLHGEYDSEDLREEMGRVDSLVKFRSLLADTLPDVPVDAFVYDFAAQIDLQELMRKYAHKTKTDKETPVIILKKPGETHAGTKTIGGTTAIEPQRFRLHDNHIYFFNQFPPTEAMSVRFIDSETRVFPAEPQTVYPLNRVPQEGGLAQRYNYNSQLWESNGQGIYRGVGVGNGRMNGIRLR